MIIYKTTNIINGKIYIGKDVYNHDTYLGSGIIIRRAIKKYGKENFKKEIIEKCNTIKELNEKEKYWIKFFNSTDKSIGYNIMEGGHGGNCKNYRYGINHPYFGKHRPANVGIAVARSNKLRPKVYGNANKSYKKIDDSVKSLILNLSQTMGRDKIYKTLVNHGITYLSPNTICRRLQEWKVI